MALFLGIDGGQSSTTAVIGDENGQVLGMGRGGPCNHVAASEGWQKFSKAIRECLQTACIDAGLDVHGIRFQVVCAGFSGGPADKATYLKELIAAQEQVVTNDAVIALSGATAGDPGIIAIAGTGSIAFGRNAQRQWMRAGGWGYVYGDEGGGFDITRQALRAVLRHEEGWGPDTSLRQRLLDVTGAADANDLLHRFYTPEFPRPAIAAFSKLVDQAARAGDAVAKSILLNAAQQLATSASAVRNRLFESGAHAKVAPVGGVFRSEIVLQRFRMLVELDDGNQLIQAQYGPAAGALLEAYAAVGQPQKLSGLREEKLHSYDAAGVKRHVR